MKLHRVHSLDSSQIRQLQTMVNKCNDSDGTRLSFPFDEADLFSILNTTVPSSPPSLLSL